MALLYTLLGVVALFIVFFIASHTKRGGAFVRPPFAWVAHSVMLGAWGLHFVASTLKEKLSTAGGSEVSTDIVARLVYLFLGLCILLGDLGLLKYRNAAFFTLVVTRLPWLPLDDLAALLWLCVPAMLGVLCLDLFEVIPASWQLIQASRLNKWVRLGLTILTFAAFLMGVVAVSLFYLWGQVQISATQPTDTSQLSFLIAFLFGVLLVYASAFALWAIGIGLRGLVYLACGLLYCVAVCVSFLLGVVGHALDVFGVAGLSPLPVPFFPALKEADSVTRSPDGGSPLSLTSVPAVGLLPERVLNSTSGGDAMSSNRNITVLYFGTVGYRLMSTFLPALEEVGAMPYVLVGGGVDVSRLHLNPLRFPSEVVDVTPAQRETDLAMSQDDSPELAFSRLAGSVVNKTVNVHSPTRKAQGSILALVDMHVAADVEAALTELKNRLRQHTMIAVTTLPDPDRRGINNKNVQEAREVFQRLYDNGVLETTIELDSVSRFALTRGDVIQDISIAKALASLHVAYLHDHYNPSFAELAERMRSAGAFVGVSMDSDLVATGQSPLLWSAWKTVNKNAPERGGGDLHDTIVQAKDLVQRVVTEEETRASAGAIDTSKPLWVLLNVPFRLNDGRFKAFANTMRPYIRSSYRNATPIIAKGAGTPDVTKGSGYFCQATLFYSLTLPEGESPLSSLTALALDATTEGKEGKGRSNGHRRASITN